MIPFGTVMDRSCQDVHVQARAAIGGLWLRTGFRNAILVAVWLAAAINLVRGYRFALGRPGMGLGDFHVYLEATRWWRGGKPLYEYATDLGLGFTYPPFAALVLAPWGFLSDGAADVLWTLTTLVSTAAFGVVLGQRTRPEWPRAVRWAVSGALVAVLSQTVLVHANLATGNISLILALLSLVECSRLFRSHRWGALSGIATAIKLTPGLFLVLHLLVDRKRAVWSIGAAIVATALAAVVLPSESWTYWTRALWQTGRVGEVDYLGNFTWTGVVARAGVEGGAGRLVGLAIGAVTAVAALWNARRHWEDNPVAAAAIVGCASVVAAPISWPHHAVWLLAWASCCLLSTSWLLRTVGALILLLLLVWVPLGSALGVGAGGSALAAVPVLAMSLAAVLRVPVVVERERS